MCHSFKISLVFCVSSSASSVTGVAGTDQHSIHVASQQTLSTIVGLPHQEDATSETPRTDYNTVYSPRTWPAGEHSDSIAVVQSTENSNVTDRDRSVHFTLWVHIWALSLLCTAATLLQDRSVYFALWIQIWALSTHHGGYATPSESRDRLWKFSFLCKGFKTHFSLIFYFNLCCS